MERENVYEKPVTLGNILKFAIPTIAMSVFMSFYTMVDGLFVSNLVGTKALSAINLAAPLIQLVTAISTMFAAGGSAVIMKKMGEQKSEEAKEDFYIFNSCKCSYRLCYVWSWLSVNGQGFCRNGAFGGCVRILYGVFKQIPAVYSTSSFNE